MQSIPSGHGICIIYVINMKNLLAYGNIFPFFIHIEYILKISAIFHVSFPYLYHIDIMLNYKYGICANILLYSLWNSLMEIPLYFHEIYKSVKNFSLSILLFPSSSFCLSRSVDGTFLKKMR